MFAEPTLEFSYKNDDLGDPLLNTSHALALGLATKEEIARIQELALKVNELLKARFARVNITLVDFKLEFGRLPDGSLVLADEISPDTCRFWIRRRTRSWTRIASAAIWAASRTPTTK